MGVFHVLALLASGLPSRVFRTAGSIFEHPDARYGGAALASAIALLGAFAGYLITFDRTVAGVHAASMLAHLPERFLNQKIGEIAPAFEANELLLFAIIESVALATLLFHFRALNRRDRRVAVVLLAAGMAAAALVAPDVDSADPYFYVGLATLGLHAYAPPGVPFGGDLRVINEIWGTPMLPSAYGPVWIGVSSVLVAPLTTLAAKLFAFKLLGLGSVIGCALLARRLDASRTVVVGILCNPALYLTYVVSAHNDLFGVDFVLAAMLAARKRAGLAFVFALAASLVKPTLAPVCLVAAAAMPSFRVRAMFAASLTLAVSLVYALDHGLIWHALIAAARAFERPPTPLDRAFRIALAAVALASGAWAVVRGRVYSQAAWAPPAFGDAPLAQYAIWGLPFALRSSPVAITYLVSLPMLIFFASTTLPSTPALEAFGDVVVLAAIVVVAYLLRPLRSVDAPAT